MASLEFRRVLNCLGYVATMAIALALATSCVISIVDEGAKLTIFRISDVTTAVVFVANVLAYFITVVAGFYYCISKRSPWFMISQVFATIVILAAVVIGAIL